MDDMRCMTWSSAGWLDCRAVFRRLGSWEGLLGKVRSRRRVQASGNTGWSLTPQLGPKHR